jgi:ribonucleotide reductase alpha subunit
MAHRVNQQETTICPKYCGSYKTLLNTGINPITEHAWERSTP